MSSSINVSDAIKGLTRHVAGMQKQVAFATKVALTRTAQKTAEAERKEMRDVFNNPTPYTMSSLFVQPATSTRLTATVKLKDESTKSTPASKFLAPQISGGQRTQKRFERALQAVGAMPAGYLAVPGAAARLDNYGNISRGQIIQILAWFKAFPEMGYKANMTEAARAKLAKGTKSKAGFAYFVGRPGDRLPLGVYQRVSFARGTAIKPVLIFVRSALYQPTFDFEYVAEKTIEAEFGGEFERAFAEAIGTAR